MRRQFIIAAASFFIGGCIVAPFAFQKGRGPAVRVIHIEALGPGHLGGVVPLSVDSTVRDGCILIVARSIERWVKTPQHTLRLVKEPLTNVPLVAFDLPPPKSLTASYPPDQRKIVPLFLPNAVPIGNEYGDPVDSNGNPAGNRWTLVADNSPLACGWEEALASLFETTTVGAHNIPIDILPPEIATPDNPPAAAQQIQPMKGIGK